MGSLYEEDYVRWTAETAAALRQGRFDKVSVKDIENVAEEIEDLGKRERRALGSHIQVLVQHLLKWHYRPGRRTNSWLATIGEQREQIAEQIDDAPSLRRLPGEPR